MSFMYSEADAGLESLSEIEGYEFLSDLDAGFEEELPPVCLARCGLSLPRGQPSNRPAHTRLGPSRRQRP